MHHPSIPPPQPQCVTPSCRRGAWPRGNVVGYKQCLREMANPRGKQPWRGKGALPHWTDQHDPTRGKEDGTKKEKQKRRKREQRGRKRKQKGRGKERDENQGEKRWRREVEEKEDPGSRTSANRSKGKEREENAREEGESSSSDSSSDDESEEEEQTPNCNARTKLERLQDSVAALEKLMVEVPNTRVAIKQEVDNLRNRLFDYTEELEESKKKEEVPRKSVCTTSRGVQTNMEPLKVKKMATMGVQVDLENPEAIKRRVDAITEKMAICEYEEITEFLNEDWPEEVFQRTEVKEGDISDIAADVAVFVTNNDEDKKAMETVKGMFPDLPGVPAEVDEDGGLGTVRVTMSAHVDGTWIDKEKYGFKLLPNKKEELESVKFLKTCRKLVQKMEELGRERVGIHTPTSLGVETSRRILEWAARGRGVTITLLGKKSRRGWANINTKPREQCGVVLISKNKEKSFADLMTEVKSNLTGRKSIDIKRIRQTRNQGISLELGGGREMAEEVKKLLSGSTCVSRAVAKGGVVKRRILMQEIPPNTTEDVIQKATEEAAGKERACDIVKTWTETRRGKRGMMSAVMDVDEDAAEKILKMRRIRVEYTSCRVIEARTEIPRCLRCLAFGHKQWNCKGQNRRGCCFRCGKEGHIASECKTETIRCLNCDVTGHVANSRRCPKFNRLVESRDH
uniref:Uncharacterized protein LOC114327334 n=1 Tax=Diabrotica virgifera virgifera TaxID=50390 RepID=A0A6P7FEF8_DIAVI